MRNRNLTFGMIAGLLLFTRITFAGVIGHTNDVKHVDVRVTPNERNIVYVDFAKTKNKVIDIRVYDQNGALIHTQKVEKNTAVITKYDLPNVANGIYSFEVIDTQMMKEKLHRK